MSVCVCVPIYNTPKRARSLVIPCVDASNRIPPIRERKKKRKKIAHTLSATLRVPHRKTAEWTTAAAWWLRAHNEANEVHKNKCVCKICHIICLESWCFAFLFVCYGAAWLFFLAGHRFYIYFFQWLWMFEWKKGTTLTDSKTHTPPHTYSMIGRNAIRAERGSEHEDGVAEQMKGLGLVLDCQK